MKPRRKAARAPGPRSRLLAAGILAVSLAAAWLSSFPGGGNRTTTVWRGYQTLLLSPQAARAGRLAHLVAALGPGVVSELTARVTFWDFTGIGSAPLSAIDDRIDPRDPRHDRLMDDLAGYFRAPAGPGAAWTALYVPARRAAVFDYLRIAAVLGPSAGRWRLLEFDPAEAAAVVIGLLAFAVLLGWSSGKEERLARVAAGAAAAVLWIPFLLGGGTARLALSLVMLFTWYRAADVVIARRGWDKRLLQSLRGPVVALGACLGAGLVLLVPAGGFAGGALAAFAVPAASSVLLLAALVLYWGKARRPRAPRRSKFDPVPIVKPAAPGPGPAGVLLVLAALTASAVIPLVRTVPVPTPVAVPGAGDFSWKSLAALARSGGSSRLPDLADLVAHEAFQETIAFGRPWGLPREDERVYVRGFLVDPARGRIVAVERRVKVFDDAWLASCLRRTPPGSVDRLLAAQGRPVAVSLRGSARPLARELPAAVLVVALFFAWLLRTPEAARAGRIRVPLMKGVLLRLNGATRRNQIP